MSNTRQHVAAAEERLFAAELADALGAPLAAVAEQPPVRRAHWHAAALAVLGTLVTIGVAWQQRDGVQAQQPDELEAPDPLPVPVCTRASDLAKIAVDSRSLRFLWLTDTQDLAGLEPFRALRKLVIRGAAQPGPWPDDLLVPIAALPELCVLGVPVQPRMTAAHLRQLATAPALRYLELYVHRPLASDDIEALRALPRLRSLTLTGGRLDRSIVRSLSLLPALDELALNGVAGCTEDVLRELRTLHRLRCVSFGDLGKRPIAAKLGSGSCDDGAGLTEGVARALAELPLLDEVRVENCAVTAAAIRCLPGRLRGFTLRRCPDAGADVVAALRHFGKLERLGLDRFERQRWVLARPAPAQPAVGPPVSDPDINGLPDQPATWRAQAELLRSLPVVRLDYLGAVPAEVRAALADAAALRTVSMEWGRAADVAAAAAAPALQRLRLVSCALTTADLAPLANVPSLEWLELRWTLFDARAAAAALPRVRVTDN